METKGRVLVDAMWLVYKTLHRLDWIQTSKGRPSGMEYGFLRILQSLEQFDRQIILCWDSRSSRKSVYDGYKKRRGQPIESDRLNYLMKMTKCVYHWAKKDGLEADDIIASLVQPKDWIHSRDKDMHQLLTDDIGQLYSWTHSLVIWDPDYVRARYNVSPCHFAMYQAFIGDKVDDIPGIHGVKKDNLSWSIEKNNGDLKKVISDDMSFLGEELMRVREFVESGEFERNLGLVTLIRDPTVAIVEPAPNNEFLKEWFQELEIFSLELCKDCGWMPEF